MHRASDIRPGAPTIRAVPRLAPVVLLAAVPCLAALFAILDGPSPGPATTPVRCSRFAAPNGSDQASGTRERPYRTAQRLVDTLRPGETGCLRGGTYTAASGDYVLRFERPGASRRPVTISGAPGERARLRGIVLVQAGADHVRIANLDLEGTGGQNTVKVYAADTVVEYSDITNRLRGESCMILGSTEGGGASRPIIRHNRFHDCGALANENHDHGIYAAIVEDAQIVDNTFVNPAATAIQLYPDAQRSYVAGNVIDGGPDTIRGGIVIGGDAETTSDDNVVEHNVIAYAATSSVYSFWEDEVGSGNVVRSNCTWGDGEQDILDDGGLEVSGNVHADPGFEDRDDGDYRLEDSACRSLLRR